MATGVALALVASLLSAVPAQAQPAAEPNVDRLRPQTERLDAVGGEVAGKGRPAERLKSATLPAPTWPKAGSARVDLRTRSLFAGRGVKAGTLPVWVRPAGTAGGRLRSVDVRVLGRASVPPAWRDALLVGITGAAGTAEVSIDYSGFRYAAGGDWASRLRLWQVPECALASPGKPGCGASQLPTSNDVKAGVASAQVTVSDDTMVALAASASGSGGDFAATSLAPSSSWASGGSSGDFSWSYPIRTPPGVSDLAPSISLSYSSGSVDGRSEATNNQPSWLGEGFEYSPGYIERRYVPCADDMAGGANNTAKTGDRCWRSDNATMSLNGRSGELVYESGQGWHSRAEDGSRVEKLTGAGNGDNDGEYWKVTATDGTQYFFGRHSLPGQTAKTSSTLTVPVFGNHSGEPCHASTFAASDCVQAWRWNLDYVVDTHGNTTSYWYEKETNQYARNNTDSDNATYDRAGLLRRIDYGTYYRTAAEHGVAESSTAPVAQVVFDVADRCLSACWSGSDPVTANWPDTPWDQSCKAGATACPQQYEPTFWSAKRLSKITTRVWDTTKATPGWQDVESWTFTHAFPNPGDGTHAGLWLDSIVHKGLVGGTVTMPAVTFEPVSLPNRVLTEHNTTNNWLRISNIVAETGAVTHVDYSLPECTASNLPSAAHTNTKRCYPVIVPDWSADPTGGTLMTEWWHKYRVDQISEHDVPLAGGHEGLSKYTYFDYVGAPAWHYTDDDGLVQPDRKTWSQFRGYATVKTRVGEDVAQQTLTVTTYLRGMNGDRLSPSGGTRSVTVPASLGSETVHDEDQFAGMVREQVVYNGAVSKPVSKTVNVPWRSNPTASRTINGDLVEARFINTKTTYSGTALGVDGNRGWRVSRVQQDFDHTYGTTNWSRDDGDIAVTGDEKCVTYAYNRNPGKNIVTTTARVTTTALACGQAPASADDIIADVRYYYDGAASTTTAPVYGDVTKTEQLKDWTAAGGTQWQTVSTSTVDSTGRAVATTDVKGNTTTAAYTPAVGGPVTKVTTTGPLNWVSSVEVNPYWGSTVKASDPNGRTTAEVAYDALGRVSKVWNLGWSRAGHETMPSQEYAYTVPAGRDSYSSVMSKALNANGNYVTSYQIFDGFLRPRQTQAMSANGDGSRVVTDTIYDKLGRAATSYGAHAEPGAPSGTLWWEPEWSVPAVTKAEYDRAGRPTASVFYAGDDVTNLVERWRTTTAYEGDLTKTTPPAGGVPTTTVTDIDGRTVALRQHTTPAGVAGAYVETRYQYDRKDQLTRVIDPAGNEWTYTYDVKGRLVETADPDKGTATREYNDFDELVRTTDARGEALWFVYDVLGRRTQVRDDSAGGALRTLFRYDRLYTGQSGFRGQLTQAIRYEPAGSANAYKWQVRSFTGRYQPAGVNYVIPAVEAGLNGTYVYSYGYSAYTGEATSITYPPGGGLVTEKVTTHYDDITGLPVRLNTNITGQDATMAATWYTPYGENTLTTLKLPGGVYVDSSVEREEGTRRVARTTVQPETATGTVSDRDYTYDDAGNITSIAENPQVGTADTQCFRYDELARLASAWTPASAVGCGPDPTVGNLGGPAPYWLDWTFDSTGNRLSETGHAAAGDTTRAYTVPTGGPGVVRPHAVTQVTTTAPGQAPLVTAYGYDDTGNMTCRPDAAAANTCPGSGSQVLGWDAEGELATVATGGGTETNTYDANGARLVRRDVTGTTLYLPGQEIRREGGANTGTRYYTLAGVTCASRTPAGVTWLYADHQGTQQIAVDAGTQAVTVRRQTPYGGPRGTNPTWPNGKGFVGGDNDPTGLVNIGARQYDPALGRFISVDPIMDLADPQQWNAYAYSYNSPITHADPTGEDPCPGGGGGCYYDGTTTAHDGVTPAQMAAGLAASKQILDQMHEQNKHKKKCGWRCKASRGLSKVKSGYNKVKEGYHAVDRWAHEHSQLVGMGVGIVTGTMAGSICTGLTFGIGGATGACVVVGGMVGGAVGSWATNYLDGEDQSAQQYAQDMAGSAVLGAVPIPGGAAAKGVIKGAAAEAAEQAAKGVAPRFITTGGGVTIDRAAVNTTISSQRQGRHVLGARQYGGGSYFNSADDAQRVLDDFRSGAADVLGVKGNDIVVRVPGVTGYNVNPGAGFPNQATNVFFIKGTRSPSVVPYSPAWTP